MLVFDWLL